MLHATSPPPARNRTLTAPLQTVHQREGETEPAIEEESRLDGEEFVAPTKGRPFGREEEREEEEGEQRAAGREEGVARGGTVGGLLGELCDVSGGKW